MAHDVWRVRAVADPDEQVYGLCGIQATAKGHFIGRTVSDPWLMPGLVVIEDTRIVWPHRFRHAGDAPDFAAMLGLSARRAAPG